VQYTLHLDKSGVGCAVQFTEHTYGVQHTLYSYIIGVRYMAHTLL